MAWERKLHFLKSNPVINFLRSARFLCRAKIGMDDTKAGESALVILYNDASGDDLDALCYKLFQEKVMKSHKYVHK